MSADEFPDRELLRFLSAGEPGTEVPREVIDRAAHDAFLERGEPLWTIPANVVYPGDVVNFTVVTVRHSRFGNWIDRRPRGPSCSVFWGSHGCDRRRGHRGAHVCRGCAPWWLYLVPRPLRPRTGWVGLPPYYGKGKTEFFGEDAPSG